MATDFSDEELAAVLERVDEWTTEFARSEYFDVLTDSQRQDAEYIVKTVAELLYKYDGLGPDDWTADTVEECCTRLYPEKVTANQGHFAAIAPVLESFFAFLDDRGHVDNGAALSRRVGRIEDEIVERAADPDNWGMAKSLLVDAAEEAGLDVGEIDGIEEAERLLEDAGAEPLDAGGSEDVEGEAAEEPRMLPLEREDRFLELYGELLVYVNDRFDVLADVESYADVEARDTGELMPLRNTLYEEDTAAIVESFVDENPADLDEEALEQVAAWTDYEFGEFMVVEHRDDAAVFLDREEPPQAFAVKAVRLPFTSLWHEDALPTLASEVALLPFDGQIVTDGWMVLDPISSMAVEMTMDADVDDVYEEAKHRFGVVESLPAPEESDRSDAERLRFYTKNKSNRERFAEEIEELRTKNERLAGIYHEQLGKARARSLGRELRDMGLNEGYFAIYDQQVVASGRTEDEVRAILEDIMPAGAEDHPYIYHYDP